MSNKLFKYYKSNIVGNLNLPDISRKISQDEVFWLHAHIAEASRSVQSADKYKWILEITEKEASRFITLPAEMNVPKDTHKIVDPVNTGVKSNDKVNIDASKRVEARLKKLEDKANADREQAQDIKVEIVAGKDDKQNLAAQARVQARLNNKNASAQINQTNKFMHEATQEVTESHKNKTAILNKIRERKQGVELLNKNDSEAVIKSKLAQSLNEKVENKKRQQANLLPSVEPTIEPTIEPTAPVSVKTKAVKKKAIKKTIKKTVKKTSKKVEVKAEKE